MGPQISEFPRNADKRRTTFCRQPGQGKDKAVPELT